MLGGCYVWKTEKFNRLDVMTLDNSRKAGGTQTTVDDQRLWTNSPPRRHRILQEQERRAWTAARGIEICRELSWARVFNDALKEQA